MRNSIRTTKLLLIRLRMVNARRNWTITCILKKRLTFRKQLKLFTLRRRKKVRLQVVKKPLTPTPRSSRTSLKPLKGRRHTERRSR